jgi:hypothetical protein
MIFSFCLALWERTRRVAIFGVPEFRTKLADKCSEARASEQSWMRCVNAARDSEARRSSVSGPFDAQASANPNRCNMLSTILIVVLILLLIGALPTWPYSTAWGYGPGGALGALLLIVVVLALLGRV